MNGWVRTGDARPRLDFRGPKSIGILEEIPTMAYGKVDRERLLAAVRSVAPTGR